MKLTTTAVLLLSSLLVLGCNDSSDDDDDATTDDTTTETDGGDGDSTTTYSQSALMSDSIDTDTGELSFPLGSTYSTGTLSLNLRMSTDETETAYIGIYGEDVNDDYKMVDIKLDESYADGADDFVGVRLRGDVDYDSDTLTDIAADTWVNFSITWDSTTTPGTYSVSIDGTDYGTFNMYVDSDNSAGEYYSIEYIGLRISSNGNTTVSDYPLYIDDITVTSESTELFSDDFESYDVDYVLGQDTDDYYTKTYGAVISDDQNATE